ncbi:MAG: hypothetical protein SGI74_09750 [Oligoflexia bacterium]|nr:hypothetical protein [Oligoflexia bacterium]
MVEFKNTTTEPIETEVSGQHKEGILHKIGDAIEKVGDVVEKRVSHKLGDAIERFGDKVEHLGDKH